MKEIQPVTIWQNGEEKQAIYFLLNSINDNLSTSATFVYYLYASVSLDGPFMSSYISTGNIGMSGEEYQEWGSQSGVDINEWAYEWAAGKLNLVIVGEVTTTTTTTTALPATTTTSTTTEELTTTSTTTI